MKKRYRLFEHRLVKISRAFCRAASHQRRLCRAAMLGGFSALGWLRLHHQAATASRRRVSQAASARKSSLAGFRRRASIARDMAYPLAADRHADAGTLQLPGGASRPPRRISAMPSKRIVPLSEIGWPIADIFRCCRDIAAA